MKVRQNKLPVNKRVGTIRCARCFR
jgi:hypothetical protein